MDDRRGEGASGGPSTLFAAAELLAPRDVAIEYRGQASSLRVFDGLRLHAIHIDGGELIPLCDEVAGKLVTWATEWRDVHPDHLVRCDQCLLRHPLD